MVKYIKTSRIPYLLDLDIASYIFQFFAKRKYIINLVHTDLKKASERGYGRGDMVCSGYH